MVDGEGIVEVSGEGVDEGCGKVMWGEVRFEMSGKDVGNLRGKVVVDTVELIGRWQGRGGGA